MTPGTRISWVNAPSLALFAGGPRVDAGRTFHYVYYRADGQTGGRIGELIVEDGKPGDGPNCGEPTFSSYWEDVPGKDEIGVSEAILIAENVMPGASKGEVNRLVLNFMDAGGLAGPVG